MQGNMYYARFAHIATFRLASWHSPYFGVLFILQIH